MLITGAQGFIGSAVSRAFETRGRATTRIDARAAAPDTVPVRAAAVEAGFLRERQIDTIVHLEWSGTQRASGTADNVEVGRRLMQSASLAGVRRFVFISSGGTVYGAGHNAPIGEDAPLQPISDYGKDKVAAERVLTDAAAGYGVDLVILRPSNVFGPGQAPWREQGLIATAMGCAISGRTLTLWANTADVRDFLYVDDVAVLIAALTDAAPPGAIVNVGSGVATPLAVCLAEIERAAGRPLTIERGGGGGGDAAYNVLDIDRMTGLLGPLAFTSLRDGLARTHDWMRPLC